MKWKLKASDLFTLFILGVFVLALVMALDWRLRASLIVFVLGGGGLLLVLAQLIVDYRARRSPVSSEKRAEFELPSFDTADPRATRRGNYEIWGFLLGLIAGVRLFGLQVTVPLFVLTYSKVYGAKWWVSIGLGLFIAAFIYGLYDQVMHIWWPEPLLLELFKKFFGT